MKPTTNNVSNEYLALGFLRKPNSLHKLDLADVLLFMFSLAWLKQFFEKPNTGQATSNRTYRNDLPIPIPGLTGSLTYFSKNIATLLSAALIHGILADKGRNPISGCD